MKVYAHNRLLETPNHVNLNLPEQPFYRKYGAHQTLLLRHGDFFRDQTVCGHHHIIIGKSEEQREQTGPYYLFSFKR